MRPVPYAVVSRPCASNDPLTHGPPFHPGLTPHAGTRSRRSKGGKFPPPSTRTTRFSCRPTSPCTVRRSSRHHSHPTPPCTHVLTIWVCADDDHPCHSAAAADVALPGPLPTGRKGQIAYEVESDDDSPDDEQSRLASGAVMRSASSSHVLPFSSPPRLTASRLPHSQAAQAPPTSSPPLRPSSRSFRLAASGRRAATTRRMQTRRPPAPPRVQLPATCPSPRNR